MRDMDRRRGEGGFFSFKTLLILLVIWAVSAAALAFLPAYYDFRVMKNLADKVVGEFADLDYSEVKRRVTFEFDSNRIEVEPEVFVVESLRDGGYSVTIDYPVTFSMSIEDLNLVPPREYRFQYSTATPGHG